MTAEYPEKVTTQLKTAVNNLSLNLDDDVGENADEIFVQTTEGSPASGSFHIENEIIFYPEKTSIKFGPGLTRGADGTTKSVHLKTLAGGEVKFGPEAHNINNLNDELIATQTALGITGAFTFALYGKNLLLNQSFESYNIDTNLPDFWDLYNTPTLLIAADTLFPARGGNQIIITCTGTGYEGIQIEEGGSNWLKVLPSTKYTFSIDYKVTAGDFLYICIKSYNGAVAGTEHVDDDTLASTDATRVTYTFTTDADADNLAIMLIAKNDGDIVFVSHPKLEQGAIGTPYILPDRDRTTKLIEATNATPDPIIRSKHTKHIITALATACEFAAPTGDIRDGDALLIRIKDNGTARALTYNAIYRAGTDIALPLTTVISKTMYLGFIYNAADSKWDLVAYIDNI